MMQNDIADLMKGVQLIGHGGVEKLEYRSDIPVPRPETGEVLIRVAAAGINNTDINTRIGWYSKTVRDATENMEATTTAEDAAWSGTPLVFPRIQGADCCGRIVAVGADVDPNIIQLITDDAAEGIGLKISKNGGLTKGRRHRDICLAAGYTISVQETTGSDIAFAAIVHLGQTVPERNLRCILESRDIVAIKTADGPFDVVNGRIKAPDVPGLGVTPRMDVLGEPIATYS